jgi:hypothetical protein
MVLPPYVMGSTDAEKNGHTRHRMKTNKATTNMKNTNKPTTTKKTTKTKTKTKQSKSKNGPTRTHQKPDVNPGVYNDNSCNTN